MAATRLSRERRSGFKEVKPAILIVGDGKSERRYFEQLRDSGTIIKVISRDTNETGIDNTIAKAHGYVSDYKLDLRRDRVAIVTDLDYRYDLEGVKTMVRKCDAECYELYLSNPCFEVWLVLHYKKQTKAMDPDQLCDLLTKLSGKEYRKSMGIQWSIQMQETAIDNANRLAGGKPLTAERCLETDPSTMVHILVESIKKHRPAR